jgi:hypothetical protein
MLKTVDRYRLARIDALVVKLLIGISAGQMGRPESAPLHVDNLESMTSHHTIPNVRSQC